MQKVKLFCRRVKTDPLFLLRARLKHTNALCCRKQTAAACWGSDCPALPPAVPACSQQKNSVSNRCDDHFHQTLCSVFIPFKDGVFLMSNMA